MKAGIHPREATQQNHRFPVDNGEFSHLLTLTG